MGKYTKDHGRININENKDSIDNYEQDIRIKQALEMKRILYNPIQSQPNNNGNFQF